MDDAALFRESIAAFLEELSDIEPIGAANDGSKALEMVKAHRHDLVLMDLQMPGLNGLETMERLRPLSPTTRVVILTGHDDDIVRGECLARGADGFVSKNYMRDELPAALRRLFPEQFVGTTADAEKT